jgi:hypothetical protein
MPSGGYRPGAGRPKGGKNAPKAGKVVKANIEPKVIDLTGQLTPLEFMLQIIQNPEADTLRRDRMAIAAAPYCHPRVSDQRVSKKDITEATAKTAGDGTEWGDDISSNVVALRSN